MGWFHSIWYDVSLRSIYRRFMSKIRHSFGDSSRWSHCSGRTLADFIHQQSLRHLPNIQCRLGVFIEPKLCSSHDDIRLVRTEKLNCKIAEAMNHKFCYFLKMPAGEKLSCFALSKLISQEKTGAFCYRASVKAVLCPNNHSFTVF